MLNKWFTNRYHEIDRGTVYFRMCLLCTRSSCVWTFFIELEVFKKDSTLLSITASVKLGCLDLPQVITAKSFLTSLSHHWKSKHKKNILPSQIQDQDPTVVRAVQPMFHLQNLSNLKEESENACSSQEIFRVATCLSGRFLLWGGCCMTRRSPTRGPRSCSRTCRKWIVACKLVHIFVIYKKRKYKWFWKCLDLSGRSCHLSSGGF